MGDDAWQQAPVLYLTLAHASSTFANFNLCPLTVINCTSEYNSFLSYKSAASELLILRMVLGTYDTPAVHAPLFDNLIEQSALPC